MMSFWTRLRMADEHRVEPRHRTPKFGESFVEHALVLRIARPTPICGRGDLVLDLARSSDGLQHELAASQRLLPDVLETLVALRLVGVRDGVLCPSSLGALAIAPWLSG